MSFLFKKEICQSCIVLALTAFAQKSSYCWREALHGRYDVAPILCCLTNYRRTNFPFIFSDLNHVVLLKRIKGSFGGPFGHHLIKKKKKKNCFFVHTIFLFPETFIKKCTALIFLWKLVVFSLRNKIREEKKLYFWWF